MNAIDKFLSTQAAYVKAHEEASRDRAEGRLHYSLLRKDEDELGELMMSLFDSVRDSFILGAGGGWLGGTFYEWNYRTRVAYAKQRA